MAMPARMTAVPMMDDLSSPLDIFIACRNLPKLDVGSPSDPFVVISIKDEVSNSWRRLFDTEVVEDNPNPDFTRQLQIPYEFETVQHIRCDVYDADDPDVRTLAKHDYIGYTEFILGDLVTADGQKLAMQLKNKRNELVSVGSMASILIVRCEEVVMDASEVTMFLGCQNLPKMDWLGRCDGFLKVFRVAEDGGQLGIAETNVVKSNYNPTFQPIKMSMQRLCNGDFERDIVIKCYDWNHNADPDYVGEARVNVGDIIGSPFSADLVQREGRKQGRNRGRVTVRTEVVEKFPLVEYIMGGCEVQLYVAIDFTASNAKSRLHDCGNPIGSRDSPYLTAIRSVGRVLEPYDSDNRIPVYGFGGAIHPGDGRPACKSHCFPLTQLYQGAEWSQPVAELSKQRKQEGRYRHDHIDPEVQGIAGVVEAYLHAVRTVQLSGPTYFDYVVNEIIAKSSEPVTQENQHYSILLIITDGVVNAVQDTIDAIVAASNYPISIVIVGVGNADFSQMDRLDADRTPLRNRQGVQMTRDIVQFVPFNDYRDQHPSKLAAATLEEIPNQATEFFRSRGIRPSPRKVLRAATTENLYTFQGGPGTYPAPSAAGGYGGMGQSQYGAMPPQGGSQYPMGGSSYGGMPSQPPQQGYPPQGYPPQQYPPQQYPPQQYPPQQYPPQMQGGYPSQAHLPGQPSNARLY